MIEQRESYTNNQKQMQNKTTPKKKEKKDKWSSRFAPIVAPVVLVKRHFHHPTKVYVHKYALHKHSTNQMAV